jgi:hypothetical protein
MSEKWELESLSFLNDHVLDKELVLEHRRLSAEMALEEEGYADTLRKPTAEELSHSRRSIEKGHEDFLCGCDLLAAAVERVARGLHGVELTKFTVEAPSALCKLRPLSGVELRRGKSVLKFLPVADPMKRSILSRGRITIKTAVALSNELGTSFDLIAAEDKTRNLWTRLIQDNFKPLTMATMREIIQRALFG